MAAEAEALDFFNYKSNTYWAKRKFTRRNFDGNVKMKNGKK